VGRWRGSAQSANADDGEHSPQTFIHASLPVWHLAGFGLLPCFGAGQLKFSHSNEKRSMRYGPSGMEKIRKIEYKDIIMKEGDGSDDGQ
jgi:hypothetical protein